jgi:hypothetical protein
MYILEDFFLQPVGSAQTEKPDEDFEAAFNRGGGGGNCRGGEKLWKTNFHFYSAYITLQVRQYLYLDAFRISW